MSIVTPGIVGADCDNTGGGGETLTRIREQADFGVPGAGVITVTDGVYWLDNDVTIDPDVELVIDATLSGRVTLRADSPAVQLIGNVDGAAFVSLPNQGVINDISIVNEGTGTPLEIAARTSTTTDANANFAFLYDCNIVSPSDFSPSAALVRILGDDSGREPPRVKINNCNLGSFTTEGSIVLQDGTVDFLDMVGVLVPGPTAPSILMRANFDGFNFGSTILGGTLGAIPANPAITVEVGATIVDPSSPRPFLVESVNFAGTISGFTVADAQVLFLGNHGIQNSLHLAAGGWTGNATATSIPSSGTIVTINDGGNIATNPEQQRFSRSGLVWTYDGDAPRNARVEWTTVVLSDSNQFILEFHIERDQGGGFIEIGSGTVEASNIQTPTGGFVVTSVLPGDEFRIRVSNQDTDDNITIVDLNFSIEAM